MFAVSLAILAFGAAGGAWSGASDHAVIAGHFERSAASPLYDLLAGVAARLPLGEPWFRLGLLDAVLGAALIVGVVHAVRRLLPKDPVAAAVSALLIAVVPAFRGAAAFPGPTVLATCGAVWTLIAAIDDARADAPTRSNGLAMFAGIAVTLGAAPWLGVGLGAAIAAWRLRLHDRETLALGLGGLGITVVLLWIGATGRLPRLGVDSDALVDAGRGGATIVVGVGLVGIGFGAITGLAHARWLAVMIAIAAAHVVLVDRQPLPMLALLAIGCAVVPSAIVRVIPVPDDRPRRRHVIAALAGLPLIAAGMLVGPAFGVDDPGHAPSRVASDLTSTLPPGPGLIYAKRTPTWSALQYERAIAGSRPDLALAPPIEVGGIGADVQVALAVRAGWIVGADVPEFGRLDLRFAFPRGRGFQLLGVAPPTDVRPIPPPAHYRSEVGAEVGTLAAVERARYEAVFGRLGAAARAAGLTERFGAADLAILSTTAPSRPAFFGFIPDLDHLPPGPWMLDLLGDDLAWSVGLDIPEVDAPRERVLHRLWRALWRGQLEPDDPQIAALGPEAVRATHEMIAAFRRSAKPKHTQSR